MNARSKDQLRKARITVAQVVQNLDVGGLERIVIGLVEHLDAKIFRSVVYCLEDGGALAGEIERTGSPVFPLNKKEGLDYFLPFKLIRLIKAEEVDIVHAHNFAPLVYGAIAGRLARVSGTVYTAHGIRSSIKTNRFLFRHFNLIDKVVAVSEDTRRALIGEGAFKPDHVETVINGIDETTYVKCVDKREKRREIGASEDSFLIGIVARLTPEKDHGTLMEAFSIIRKNLKCIELVIAGDGPLKAELIGKAEALGIDDAVFFLGTRLDIPELLKIFDVFVLSSVTEGLSITLLEAMAAELPVIATDVGGNPEVVMDGETGLIIRPKNPADLAEAMYWVFSHRDLAREMGQRGKKRVSTCFSLKIMVNNYENIYMNLARR